MAKKPAPKKTKTKKGNAKKAVTKKAVTKKSASAKVSKEKVVAKKAVTNATDVKTLGKAKKLTTAVLNERSRSLIPPVTDEKLDVRQMEKGLKRKAFGPVLKKSASSSKMASAAQSPPVPPTEVD